MDSVLFVPTYPEDVLAGEDVGGGGRGEPDLQRPGPEPGGGQQRGGHHGQVRPAHRLAQLSLQKTQY